MLKDDCYRKNENKEDLVHWEDKGRLQFCRVVRGSVTEKVTCEQRFEGSEGVSHVDI